MAEAGNSAFTLERPVVVAVDGPVAAGKGTLARLLAEHFRFAYLDTGALYRAVALRLLRRGESPDDPACASAAALALDPADLAEPALRDERVGLAAARVAAMAEVRVALLAYQRNFASQPPGNTSGAVLDGRDIGTVIWPEAQAKLFVTARPEVRAKRRYSELLARAGSGATRPLSEAAILADLLARDAQDQARALSPLKPAADAYLLDTSDLSIEGAFAAARDFVLGKLSRAC